MSNSLDNFLIGQRNGMVEENRKIWDLLERHGVPRKRPDGEFYSILEGIEMLLNKAVPREDNNTALEGICPYTDGLCIDEGGYCTDGDCLVEK